MKNPIYAVLFLLSSVLLAEEKVTYIGVGTLEVTAEERVSLNLPEGIGLKVDFLIPGAPAEAVLEMEDVLTKLDDQWLVNPEQLAVLVRMRKPGEEVRFTVLRGGETRNVSVVLGQRLREEMAAEDTPDNSSPIPLGGGLDLGGNAIPAEVIRQLMEARNFPGEGPLQQGVQIQMGGVFGGAGARVTRRVQFIENGLSVMFHQADGKSKVNATRDGKVEFDGEVNTPEERAKIPAALRQKLVEKQLIPADPEIVP